MQAEENAKFPHENVLVRVAFSEKKDIGRNNPVVGVEIGQGRRSVDFGAIDLFRESRSFCAESFFFDFGGLTTRCHTSINALSNPRSQRKKTNRKSIVSERNIIATG